MDFFIFEVIASVLVLFGVAAPLLFLVRVLVEGTWGEPEQKRYGHRELSDADLKVIQEWRVIRAHHEAQVVIRGMREK